MHASSGEPGSVHLRRIMLAGWLFVGLVVSATGGAESEQDLRYRFSVESADRPIPFGTVWLYHYSWSLLSQLGSARPYLGQHPALPQWHWLTEPGRKRLRMALSGASPLR